MTEMPPKGSAPWGLVLTTLALVAALVATSVAAYKGAREGRDDVIRARAVDMHYALRQALREFTPITSDALDEIRRELHKQGLRFIGLTDGMGKLRLWAGESVPPPPKPEDFKRLRAMKLYVLDDESRVRVLVRIGQRRFGRPRFIRRRDRAWKRHMRWLSKRYLVFELEPVVAQAIEARALRNLIASLAAALLLLGTAFFFWRAQKREEILSRQLARHRELKKLGEVSAVLGHEIRNPLAAIKGHAQLLVEKLEGHPARKGAERVVREAERIERLAGQVLDFARTGELDLRMSDPLSMISDAARETACALGVPAELIKLEFSKPPPGMILFDKSRMEQVMGNLIRNAFQSAGANSTVTVSCCRAGNRLVIKVRDQGPGISGNEREALFEPFRTGRVKGTGLGLTVSRRIVEQHGGAIRADNHPEGGAVFTIELPAAGA